VLCGAHVGVPQETCPVCDVAVLREALESIVELTREDECDCPPEWPRCVSCRTRLRANAALARTAPPEEK
jgi:hypothetical protein